MSDFRFERLESRGQRVRSFVCCYLKPRPLLFSSWTFFGKIAIFLWKAYTLHGTLAIMWRANCSVCINRWRREKKSQRYIPELKAPLHTGQGGKRHRSGNVRVCDWAVKIANLHTISEIEGKGRKPKKRKLYGGLVANTPGQGIRYHFFS